jgi:hypothetical protein
VRSNEYQVNKVLGFNSNIVILEIFIDFKSSKAWRRPIDSKELMIELGEKCCHYGTISGQTMKIFVHVTGAHSVDTENGESNWQFQQASWLRSWMFPPTCDWNAFRRYGKNSELWIPEHRAQAIRIYSTSVIEDIKHTNPELVELRILSKAAENPWRGFPLYTWENGRAEWWRNIHPEEEVIIHNRTSLPAKTILFTDSPKTILTAKQLLSNGRLELIKQTHPKLETIIKITGNQEAFCRNGVNVSRDPKTHERKIGSGENSFCQVADISGRIFLQLLHQDLINLK